MSLEEKVYPSGIRVKFQRAESLLEKSPAAFQKPSTAHNTLQQREIWRTPPPSNQRYCINHTFREKFRGKRDGRYTRIFLFLFPCEEKFNGDENELQRIRGWCNQERRGDKDKNAAIANLIESFQSIGLIEFEANKTDVQRGVIR